MCYEVRVFHVLKCCLVVFRWDGWHERVFKWGARILQFIFTRKSNRFKQIFPRMDHYCPYVGNCIGAMNHGHFWLMYLFLFAALTQITYLFTKALLCDVYNLQFDWSMLGVAGRKQFFFVWVFGNTCLTSEFDFLMFWRASRSNLFRISVSIRITHSENTIFHF